MGELQMMLQQKKKLSTSSSEEASWADAQTASERTISSRLDTGGNGQHLWSFINRVVIVMEYIAEREREMFILC